MDTRIRYLDEAIWEDFKESAKAHGLTANQLLLELVAQESKKWRKGEDARILKRADEIRQGKLLV